MTAVERVRVDSETNLLFFTKGEKTKKTWYYDLSGVKVGKKIPLKLEHFGFGKSGEVIIDMQDIYNILLSLILSKLLRSNKSCQSC